MSIRKTVQSATAAALLALAMPASAQQADIGAIYKRSQELYAAGNYPATLVEAQKLEAAVKAQFGTNYKNYAVTLINLANLYQSQGKYGEAEGLCKRALAIRETTLGANHLDLAQTLNNLAVVYQLQSKYSDAEGLYKRALADRGTGIGLGHRFR